MNFFLTVASPQCNYHVCEEVEHSISPESAPRRGDTSNLPTVDQVALP